MSALPRLGFLGVGWIGRHRMRALAESDQAVVAAIADPSQEMLDAAREVAPGAIVADGLPRLLELDLDGIVIATPSSLHAAQSIAVLDRGMAVFCQKPVGRTAIETAKVVECARRADRYLGVDLSYRHTAALRCVRDVVRSGELGEIYAADLVFHNAYGPDKAWFYDAEASGGGCVMDLGIHLVDAALHLLDFPEVRATTSRLFHKGRALSPDDKDVEDYALARLDLADGQAVQLACSWNLPAGRDAVIEIRVYGSQGGAAMRNVNGSFYDFVAERYRGTRTETLIEPPDAWGGRAAVAWARALRGGARFDPESERLVDVARVLDAVYRR